MYKRDIYLDIDDKLNEHIKSVELDSNSRVWHFHLMVDYEPLDLTGKSVHFRAEKPDKTNVLNDCKIVDAEKGVVEVKLTRQVNAIPGHVKCLLKIIGDEGFVLKTKTFVVDVSKTLSDDAIVSSDEFGALEAALGKVQDIDNRFAQTNAQLSTKAPKSDVNNIQQQLNNLVLGAVGDGNNAEVVQARGQYSVINDRLNATDNQINRLYEDYYMNLVYSPFAVVVNQKFINHSGVITSSSALARYITVPIKAKNPLYIHSNYGYPLQKGSLGQIQILDKDYNVLSVANDNLVAGYDVTVDNVGSDACYARFNTAIAGNDYVGQLYVGQIRYHEHYMEDKLIDIKYNSLRNDFTEFTSDLNSAHVKHKTILTGSKNYINGELVNVMSDNVYANDIVYDESLSITSLTFKVNVKVAGEYTYTLYTLEKNTNTITGVHDVILSTNNVGVQEINVDTNGLLLPSNNYLLIKYVDDNCALTYTKNGTGGTLLGYKNVTPEKGDVITSKESMNGLLNYKLTYRIIQSLEKSLNTIEDKLREINDDSNSNNSNNRLYGKKIVAIGDSMVKGHTLNENQTWLAKIANRNNMTYVNYGINGGFLSRKPGLVDGCDGVCDRYTGMDDDADYVVVFAGTNDAASQVTLGDESSVSKNEFYGALVQLCKGLLTKYPTKRILFITPYRKYSAFKPYIEAIEVVCGSYGIPVFNNEKRSGISWAIQAQKDAFTLGDNTHLNEAGHEYVSYRYEEELRRL